MDASVLVEHPRQRRTPTPAAAFMAQHRVDSKPRFAWNIRDRT
jgi:hypothetical protein